MTPFVAPERLGWPDPNVTGYVSSLLVDFTHTDRLYKIRNQKDQPVDTVVDLLFESELSLQARRWSVNGICIGMAAISRSS